MSASKDREHRAELDRLIRGFQISRMLRVAADLTLADRIPRGEACAVAELAAQCAVRAEPLLRVLRALASFGIFRVSADGAIAHSALSLLLRTDTPQSLHYGAKFWAASGSWRAWGELDAALTGGVPHEAAWHMGRFEYLRRHPDEARDFDAFMAHFPDERHRALAEAYDFSGATLIADIGGGNGEALRCILERFPQARGLLFDREDVVAAIPEDARAAGRVATAGGSFLDRVPPGADVYVLMRVLHNWSDADCGRILRNCRSAMRDDARLLICEHLLEPDPGMGDPVLYLVDTQMMAMFGAARERTEAAFGALLAQSGFALRRVIATKSRISIVEAAPA